MRAVFDDADAPKSASGTAMASLSLASIDKALRDGT
jgi:hypothetical protein